MIVFFFLCGFGLTVIGSTYIITYMNLFSMGYNFRNYVNFIIRRYECWYLVLGIMIMLISVYIGGKKNELHL